MYTKEKSLLQVINCFVWNQELSPTQISDLLWKSKTIVHKYLKILVDRKELEKTWKWTHTKYKLVNTIPSITKVYNEEKTINLDYKEIKIIEENFFKFEVDGTILKGQDWFTKRCTNRNFDLEDKANNFIKIQKQIENLKNNCWLIDVTKHFNKVVIDSYINKVYYADQYNWMEFGRWKLAEITFFAKQSQNKTLIKKSINMIKHQLNCLIRNENIEAIGIIPFSIKRENQLLKILKLELKGIWIPFINIEKYFVNNIPIPQKTLKTREQRLENAIKTIIIDDQNIAKYSNILLIDDFVWSGNTLNQTAKKLKAKWIHNIIGFAFVWNTDLKYEVINEV